MANKVLNARILVYGGTAAALANENKVLMTRELAYESDTQKLKVGDGVTNYNDLPYFMGDIEETLANALANYMLTVDYKGSADGVVASADKLQTARTINGTAFDGSANITTANWGTARNISIADATAANTGTAVSVNGSAAVTLKLPATIVADISGNADTATKLETARTINGVAFDGTVNITVEDDTKIPLTQKGAANGVATLDANGLVPSDQLPSYVDDVIEGYYSSNSFYEESAHTTEITGETGKIYVDLSTGTIYRYSGSTFISISNPLDIATTAEAVAGTNDTKAMTPAKVKAAIDAGDFMSNGDTAGGDLTGTYPSPSIAASAVTTDKIADGAITDDKIDAVSTSKLYVADDDALILDGGSATA